MTTPADTLKATLRADLTNAVKARDSAQASLLRVLVKRYLQLHMNTR